MPSSSEHPGPPPREGGGSAPPPRPNVPPGPVDLVVAPLLEAMGAAWERGERPPAEDFLARPPEVRDHPEAAVRVIYEEICLRQEHGLDLAPADLAPLSPVAG